MLAKRCVKLALIVSLLSGLSASAADSPISAFPKDAGVIVRLKNPQKTLQKAGDLAVKVDRTEGVKVQLATPLLGMMISNPSLKGVDLNGDWWLAVFPVENGDPGAVFCIPATDAEAMQKSVMGNYQFQTFDKWVIYTEHEPTAAKIKEHLAAKEAAISSLLDKTSTAVWDEGDLSVFINVPQLLKVYRGPFDQGVQKVNDFIEQFPSIVPPQQNKGVDMKAIADMYAGLFKSLVQAVEDAEGLTGSLAISAEGISGSKYVKFAENSATVKALANNKPSNLEYLDQLPANRLVYAATEWDMSGLMKWGMKYSLQMFAEGDTEKETQVKKLMAEYEKVHISKMAMTFGLGNPKQGAMRAASIVEVDNPEQIRKLSVEAFKFMSNYQVGGITMKMSFLPASETYGDLKADVARMKYEIDPQADPLQVQAKMYEVLYGPEGMTTRTLYLKNRMAQCIGGDKADVQALLDAMNGKNAVGGQASYQATPKQLPAQANFIGLADYPGMIASGINLAIQSGAPIPLAEDDLKNIRGEPSFTGFSVRAEANGLRAKAVVPVAQMQGIGKLIRKIREARQPAQ
jgi:hypothetical protein